MSQNSNDVLIYTRSPFKQKKAEELDKNDT